MLLAQTGKEPEVKQIRFDGTVENGVNVYRYLLGADPPVDTHWAGLYQTWREGPTPWTEYAVNNNNTKEIAVYLGLTWRATEGLARYGIAAYYRDKAAAILRQERVLTDWEYHVAADEPDPARRDRGFVPGGPASRSGRHRPTGSPSTRPRPACSPSPGHGT